MTSDANYMERYIFTENKYVQLARLEEFLLGIKRVGVLICHTRSIRRYISDVLREICVPYHKDLLRGFYAISPTIQ